MVFKVLLVNKLNKYKNLCILKCLFNYVKAIINFYLIQFILKKYMTV